MKKSFFYLAASVLALSACSFEKVLDESEHSNAIVFENAVSKLTRADGDAEEDYTNKEIDMGNFKQFSVFGYYTTPAITAHGIVAFNNVAVTKTANGWGYDNTRYWVPGATYNFYAYCCGGIKLSNTYGTFAMDVNASESKERVLKINDYKCNANHQHDLLFAVKEGIASPSEEATAAQVAFKFSHILTRVNAIFTSDFAPEYTIEISNVKITGIQDRGWYNPNYATEAENKGWYDLKSSKESESDPTPYVQLQTNRIIAQKGGEIVSIDGATTTEITEKTAVSGSAFVLPTNGIDKEDIQNAKISFTIDIKKGDDLVLNTNLSGDWKPVWKPGYKYTYNIAITGTAANLQAIVFTTETEPITGWESEDDEGVNNEENKLVISAN